MKMKRRIAIHLAFWLFFVMLFVYENTDEFTWADLGAWVSILGIIAGCVYLHLYVVFERLFFRRHYVRYALALLLLLGTGSLLITTIFQPNDYIAHFFQNIINVFIFLLITSSLRFFRENTRQQLRLQEIENKQLRTELALLRAQVNPHFLFNTLNNLYGLITTRQHERSGELVLRLADLMRYLLDSSQTDRSSLQKEVRFIQDYIALEQIRLPSHADIRWVSNAFADCYIAPVLLVPLVENVFKHGFHPGLTRPFAHFELSVSASELFFEVRNAVFVQAQTEARPGGGIDNLRKRLDLLYPDRHRLDIQRETHTFHATLYIRLDPS